MLNPRPLPTPRLQQLPLPGLSPAPPRPVNENLPAPLPLPPQDIWSSLSPALRAQVRGTILQVLQEVLDDYSGS